MSARSQVTELAHGGRLGEEVTLDQTGSPERLWSGSQYVCLCRVVKHGTIIGVCGLVRG
jgi:hypothetical protein